MQTIFKFTLNCQSLGVDRCLNSGMPTPNRRPIGSGLKRSLFMTENAKTLTTGEFSKITGMPVSTLTRMLRQGRIRGEKRGAKWAIFENEVHNVTAAAAQKKASSSSDFGPIFEAPVSSGKTYDIKAFSKMTYLTEKGVRQWLASGRLTGRLNPGGEGVVDAANLDRPELRHLIRK
jgi:excisionase family DNA binding protein